MSRQRTLATGKTVTLHSNDGLRKRCDCPRRAWAKCSHPWHFSFKWQDTHYRFPLGRPFTWKGQQLRCPAEGEITTRDEAKSAAEKLRASIREGHFPPAPTVATPTTPSDLSFEQFAEKWRTIARATMPDSLKANDAAICQRLRDLLIDGERLATRPLGLITEDVMEQAFGQLSGLQARPGTSIGTASA